LNALINDNEGLLVLKINVQENPQSSPLANPALPLKTAHALSRSTEKLFQFYRPFKKLDQN
jgi:hypothetical protein